MRAQAGATRPFGHRCHSLVLILWPPVASSRITRMCLDGLVSRHSHRWRKGGKHHGQLARASSNMMESWLAPSSFRPCGTILSLKKTSFPKAHLMFFLLHRSSKQQSTPRGEGSWVPPLSGNGGALRLHPGLFRKGQWLPQDQKVTGAGLGCMVGLLLQGREESTIM